MIKNEINRYQQDVKLKDKLKIINEFKINLENELIKKYNLFKIDVPLISEKESIFISRSKNQRLISFDSFNRDSFFYFNDDFTVWLKNKIVDLEISIREGLIYSYKKINRDINNFSPLESSHLAFEYILSYENARNESFIKDIFLDLMNLIKDIFKSLDISILKNNSFFDYNRIQFKNYSNLKNKYLSKKNLIENACIKYQSTYIKGISELYIDDHKIFNPYREDEYTTTEFLYLNKTNKKICSIVKIYIRPIYEKLIEQLQWSKIDITDDEFLKKIYSNSSINVDINLSNLYSCVFKEYSNSESTNSCETKEILEVLKAKKIKVM